MSDAPYGAYSAGRAVMTATMDGMAVPTGRDFASLSSESENAGGARGAIAGGGGAYHHRGTETQQREKDEPASPEGFV